MPVSIKAEALIFAINAGMKLSMRIQQALTIKIVGADIALPPLRFDQEPNHGEARTFFNDLHPDTGGAQFLSQSPTLTDYHQRIDSGDSFGPHRALYIEFYKKYKSVLTARQADTDETDRVSRYELLAPLHLIQQWEADEATEQKKSALQLVAGTLIELGIDYFQQVPGVIQPDTPTGRALMHFLTALDRIPFSDREGFRANSNFILPRLFVAAADSLVDLSPEITADPKLQTLLEVAGQGLSEDIYGMIENLQPGQRADDVVQWGQIMLRSIIKNGAGHVVENASSLLMTNEGGGDLIKATGSAFLHAILPNDSSSIDLRNAFSVASLDRMMGAALEVISEHPELVSSEKAFQQLVTDMALSLQSASVGQEGLLPDLVRMIFERTAGHVHLLWGQGAQAGQGKHLLLSATQQILLALSTEPQQGGWVPQVNNQQLLDVVSNLLDEVVMNPAWILGELPEKSPLRLMLNEVFGALEAIPQEHRFGTDVVQYILQLSVRSLATSDALLSKLKWGNTQEETTVIQKGLDLVFASLFSKDSDPSVNRALLLTDLLEYSLLILLRDHPNAKGLSILQLILFENEQVDYSNGFDSALADSLIESGLAVLSASPQLISKDKVFQNLIADVAATLNENGWKQANLSPRILRAILMSSAANADLIVDADSDEPRFLLAVVLSELLQTLSHAIKNDHWAPQMGADQLLALFELLLDEVVAHPYWIPTAKNKKSLLGELMDGTLSALSNIPMGERLQPETFSLIVSLSVTQAATHPKLLKKIKFADDATEKSIIERALALVFDTVFTEGKYTAAERSILLIELIEYIFEIILTRYPNERGLQIVGLVLQEAQLDWSEGFDKTTADQVLFAAIEVVAAHPHMLGKPTLLRDMASQVAEGVTKSGIKRPDLIPEIIRLTFSHSADALEQVISKSSGGPKFLLAIASQQVLKAWSTPARRGKWKPRLSDNQLLDIIALMLSKSVEHPDWVGRGSLLQKLMSAVLRSLEKVPKELPMPFEVLYQLLEECLETVRFNKVWLVQTITVSGNRKRVALEYALEKALVVIYDEDGRKGASWTLSQAGFLNALLHHYLQVLAMKNPTKTEIDKRSKKLNEILDKLHAEKRLLLEVLHAALADELDA